MTPDLPHGNRLGRAAQFAAIFALFGVLAGCDRPPSDAAAREWTPADHDHTDDKAKLLSGGSSGGRGPKQAAPNGSGSAAQDTAAVVELAWQKQCSLCHGPQGKGDGPQGAMFKAPDLTRADWQQKTSDDAMATTIKNGKGAMPKFDLPPEVIGGLVARIRAARSK